MAKTYGSAFICQLLGIPRTTLFRWELTIDDFPKPKRNTENERVYTSQQVKDIIKCLNTSQRRKVLASIQRHIANHERQVATLKELYNEVSKL